MMRMMSTTTLVLMVAACGGDAKPAVSGEGRAAAAVETSSGTTTPDACVLVTTADLGTVFAPRAFAVDTAGPPRNRVGKSKQASVTSCTFATTDGSLSDLMSLTVMVTTTPSDGVQPTADEMKQGAVQLGLGAKPIEVSGLGEAAYWVNLGSAQRSSVALNVKRGAQWLTVSESSSGQSIDDTVARLTKVAEVALGRM